MFVNTTIISKIRFKIEIKREKREKKRKKRKMRKDIYSSNLYTCKCESVRLKLDLIFKGKILEIVISKKCSQSWDR